MLSALVTGSAKRIGKEIVLKLSKIGYNIALHYYKSEKEALKLAKEIKNKTNQQCELFQANLSKTNNAIDLIKNVHKKFKNVSLLINNASYFYRFPLLKTPINMINYIIDLNFKTPLILTKEFAKTFNNGHIINLLDSKINYNDKLYFIYNLSKKCLRDLTFLSAKELAPKIRVNGIAPGYILENNNFYKKIESIPLKKKGSLKQITDTIDFLIKNTYITGQVIYVDGGDHLL